MPNHHAVAPHTMMATMAAMSAMSAARLSPPKSTIEKMVAATAVDTSDTSKSPRKLQTAAMMMAWRGFMARVDTAVAMALGASVAPLTTMTPMLSTTTTTRTGFWTSWPKKNARSMVTVCAHPSCLRGLSRALHRRRRRGPFAGAANRSRPKGAQHLAL